METQKIWNYQRKLGKKRTELEVSCSLTSDYTTELQQSKQYGAGTETDT